MRVIVLIMSLALPAIVLLLLLVMSSSGVNTNSDTLALLVSSCYSYFWFLLPIPSSTPLLSALLLLVLLSLLILLDLVWCRANELERLTNVGVTGADGTAGETSAARELHAALRDVREGLIKAQKLWRGAEEAADKCQVRWVLMVVVGGGCWGGCLCYFFVFVLWMVFLFLVWYTYSWVGGLVWMGSCLRVAFLVWFCFLLCNV